MKIKKIFNLLISAIVISNVLTACSNTDISNKEESNEQAIMEEVQENIQGKDIKMLHNNNFGLACGSKEGYYSIYSNEDGMTNIMYVDYKTKKQIYLCDKSECNHDNEKCTSFIDFKYAAMEKMLLCDDKYLYLITSEYNNTNGISTSISYGEFGGTNEDQPTTIYRMNLDGSNKKLLATLNTGESLSNSFFTDGNYIYGIAMKNSTVILDDNSSYADSDSCRLIGISNDNGEVKEISKWDSNWSILGTFNNKVIVKQLKFNKELTIEDKIDEEKYKELLSNADDVIVAFDIKTREFEHLISNKSSNDYYYNMYGKDIFYYSYNGNKIMSFDLNTKEEYVFLESKYSNIQQIYDGYIISSDWSDDNTGAYLINIDNKSINDFKLIKNNGFPVNIIAESKDLFFVESNCDIESEYVEWAGITQEIETNRQYSLISKEDFFNGNKNYENVKLLVEELN